MNHAVRAIALTSFGFAMTAAFIADAFAAGYAEDSVAPSAIVASPATYDGKDVTVTGKVAKFQLASTAQGTIAFYQLCDAKCVVVIDKTKPAYQDGDQKTATGTFHPDFKGPKRSFTNVVIVK